MIKKYIPYSALLAILLSACSPKEIPIHIQKAESRMVVASQIIPNNIMLITLSRSFDALIPTDTTPGNDLLNQILVGRAFVTVSYLGKTDTLTRLLAGIYGSQKTPLLEDVFYTLYAYDSLTGKSISAETNLRKKVNIDTSFVSYSKLNKDTQRTLSLTFADGPEEDYYMVNIYRNTEFVRNTILNPVDIFNINNNSDVTTVALSDKTFGSALHTEKFDINQFKVGDTLTVTLSHIDKNYFTYLQQKERSARNGLGNFFGEPVNYITNVKNGYGFFTAYWPQLNMLIIKE